MPVKKLIILIIALMFFISFSISLMAQDSPVNKDSSANSSGDSISPRVGKILIVFLVLSIVFEVALTPIFNWRFFLQHFEGKGYKTPIIITLAFVVFWSYDLDIVKDLLNALDYQAKMSIGGQFLTALLIAGGSDGIFRIFTKLGIRNPVERKEKADEAREEMREKEFYDSRSSQ